MGRNEWWSAVGIGIVVCLLAPRVPAYAAAPVFGPAAPVTADATTDTGNDGTPRIVSDGHGTWVTIWAATGGLGGNLGTDSDVLAVRSYDLGISWSLPVAVNGAAASDAEFDFAPALATDGNGLWIAVWVATNGPDTDVFYARSTDAGATWSATQPLHADAATDAGNDDHPQIVTDGAGTWIVVWDANARTGADRDVFFERSTDGGATWSAPAPLAANATTDRGNDQRPQLATDGAGRWVVVWASNDTLGGTKGNDFDILTARSSDGGATWSPAVPLNTNAATDKGLDDRPQVVTDGLGTWLATWVSDESFGGALGTDLDVLTARSTDGGVTWSAPMPLNTNAATDAGEDGAPALATDRAGTWVAVWESTDTLGDTLGSDYDVLMAHSIDGGAHWSAPRALDPDAATDTRRDVAPQIATSGGVWNVIWSASGGGFGTDGDVLRAGGREKCGDGVVDPGEQCDDGNAHGGDACPATCEFPPTIATPAPGPTPGPGATPAGSATPTAGGTGEGTPATPVGGGEGTGAGSATSTPNGATSATPTPTDTALDGATPSVGPSEQATPTTAASADSTPTPDSYATATASAPGSPAATTTPSFAVPTPTPASPPSGPTAAATPHPVPTFAGSLVSTARAKAAVACQRAVLRAGARLVGTRLANLGSCGRAVQRCIQTKPGEAACLDAAAARCRSALGALATADRKQAGAIAKRCGGSLPLDDLLAPAGLGYGGISCGADGESEGLDDLVACVVDEHACRGAALFEVLQPRAKELLRLPGMNAATLDTIVCLPDHGGDGTAVGDPSGQGKAVDVCTAAIVKAGTSFVRKRLARLAKCADGLFTCVQLAPNDGACLAKARTRCDQGDATSAKEERALTKAVAARCAEHVIAYATLRAARAANLDALDDACTAVGVSELASLADYQQCVLRADACRIEGVLALQAPRSAELAALVGRSFASPYCDAP